MLVSTSECLTTENPGTDLAGVPASPAAALNTCGNVGAEAVTHCFSLQALASPGLLERVLGQLSKRGMVPSRVVADSDVESGKIVLDVQVAGLNVGVALHLAQRLRGLPDVETVLLCTRNGMPVLPE